MKRIEIHENVKEPMPWGIYQIMWDHSHLLARCLTEGIAIKVKEALEK